MNPYEIRHAILNEARAMLFDVWHEKCRDVQALNSMPPYKYHSSLPEAPTFEEILELAQRMNTFVSNGKE